MSEKEKYDNLFIGAVIGVALVLLLGWYVRSTEPKNPNECIRACEKESINRTEAWTRECVNLCLEDYKVK